MSNGRDLSILFRRYYNDPKVGLATACEKCGAQPGAPCLTVGGNTVQTHHLYRHRRAWSAAHQAMSGKGTK